MAPYESLAQISLVHRPAGHSLVSILILENSDLYSSLLYFDLGFGLSALGMVPPHFERSQRTSFRGMIFLVPDLRHQLPDSCGPVRLHLLEDF